MAAPRVDARAESAVTSAPPSDDRPGALPSAIHWIVGLAAFVFLGAILPFVIVSAADDQATLDPYAVVALWGVCVFSSFRLSGFLVHRRARLIGMAFYVFCYVFIGLTPLAQVAAGHFPTGRYVPTAAAISDVDTIARTATLFLIGIAAHELAYQIAGRFIRSSPPEKKPADSDDGIPGALDLWLVHALCLAGILISLVAVAQSGFTPFFTSRDAAGAALISDADPGSSGLVWYRVSHTVPFVGFFLLLHLLRRDETKRTPGYILVAVILAACNIVINNPVGNSRLWGNAVIFGLLSVFIDLRRPRAVAWTAVGLTSAFLLVFPYADLTRRTGQMETFLTPLQEWAWSGSFSAFQTAANGIRYVEENGHSWGYQLLGGIFTLVPRAVWTTKPPDTGFLIDPIYNRAATIWTEMHVNFGVVGVVVGLTLLGAAARFCDERFMAGHRWALLIVPILSTYYFIILRGTLSAAVGAAVPVLVTVLLPLAVRRRRMANGPTRGALPPTRRPTGPSRRPARVQESVRRGRR